MKLQHPPNGHRLKEELARAVARAEAAEKRIAELEAQLAAQAWRYGEKPPKKGTYAVKATGRLDSEGDWHIYVGAALVGAIDHKTDIHWRPIDPSAPA